MAVRLANIGDPRMMIQMDMFSKNKLFRIGSNNHYTLDTPIVEALAHFFSEYAEKGDDNVIDPIKSKLKIVYLDMPKIDEACLSAPPTEAGDGESK